MNESERYDRERAESHGIKYHYYRKGFKSTNNTTNECTTTNFSIVLLSVVERINVDVRPWSIHCQDSISFSSNYRVRREERRSPSCAMLIHREVEHFLLESRRVAVVRRFVDHRWTRSSPLTGRTTSADSHRRRSSPFRSSLVHRSVDAREHAQCESSSAASRPL
jgi:hypothetical protein